MSDALPSIYSISELAELGGVSRRTVRYYVRRGLIPSPTGTGRGKHYTQAHLDALVRVRDLQSQGVSLDEILARDAAKRDTHRDAAPAHAPTAAQRAPTPEQHVCVRIRVDDGVELLLRRPRVLDTDTTRRLAEAVRAVLDEAAVPTDD